MIRRNIVYIDEEKCDGCGVCIPACAEGALQIIDGKAKLIGDKYCDGLGDCLGNCPQDAIHIIKREAEEYDQLAVDELLAKQKSPAPAPFSCPGSRVIDKKSRGKEKAQPGSGGEFSAGDVTFSIKSQLKQWPVQLMLVPTKAPFFDNSHLLITADCVPIADPNYHLGLLKGKSVVIGCPKLDDSKYYVEKLAEIFRQNNIKGITVAHMEVPCCFSMIQLAHQALALSGKDIPLVSVEVPI